MKYYNVNEAISRNRPLNFIVGARGIGKTYGFKKYIINRFIKNGEQFIYLRQSQREVDGISDFWGSLPEKFKGHEFKQYGRRLKIDGKDAGEMHALSEYVQMKSNEYNHVRYIIFDEFLDNSNWTLRAEKPYALASIMDTVFRNRKGCRCFCLANAEQLMNEYFEFFNVYPNKTNGVTLTDDIAIEVVDPSRYDVGDERANNWLGRITRGTSYAEVAQANSFQDNGDQQIAKLPAGAELIAKIYYQRDYFEIWYKGLKVYITATNHPNKKANIFTIHDSQPGREIFKNNIIAWDYLTTAANTSDIYFDSKRTREICYVWLKKFVNIK